MPGRFYSQTQVLRGSGILDGPVHPFHDNPAINRRKNIKVVPGDGQAVFVLRIAQTETQSDMRDLEFAGEVAKAKAEWERLLGGLPATPARYASRLSWPSRAANSGCRVTRQS